MLLSLLCSPARASTLITDYKLSSRGENQGDLIKNKLLVLLLFTAFSIRQCAAGMSLGVNHPQKKRHSPKEGDEEQAAEAKPQKTKNTHEKHTCMRKVCYPRSNNPPVVSEGETRRNKNQTSNNEKPVRRVLPGKTSVAFWRSRGGGDGDCLCDPPHLHTKYPQEERFYPPEREATEDGCEGSSSPLTGKPLVFISKIRLHSTAKYDPQYLYPGNWRHLFAIQSRATTLDPASGPCPKSQPQP